MTKEFIITVILLVITGCRTPSTKPVIVQVDPGEASGGRFRSLERQRDLWIAPQATDNETLLHEQLVTFIEKPTAWQLPSTLEPNTISRPDLPLEQGDYDGEVLKRQQEIIQDKQAEALKIMTELENLKHQSQQTLSEKDEQLKVSVEKNETAQRHLAKAFEQ